MKDYVNRVAKDVSGTGGRYLPGTASIPAAMVGTSATPSSVRSAPSHRFFGDILMTYLSVDEQDAAIRRDFPEFELKAKAGWIGVWEGPIKPARKTTQSGSSIPEDSSSTVGR